jgi:hypothetical protein
MTNLTQILLLCVKFVIYQNYTEMHSQQNIKNGRATITNQSRHHVVKSATTLFCSNVQDLIWTCITLHRTHLLLQLTVFTENWVTSQNAVTDRSLHENNAKQHNLDSNYGLTAKMKLLPVVIKWCYISNCYKLGWTFFIPGFYLMQAQSYPRTVIVFTCNTKPL